jgi:tetratricopeptide (TPR) repeat protein
MVAMHAGDLGEASSRFEESLRIMGAVGDIYTISAIRGSQGQVALLEGRLGAARMLIEESLALHRELDYTRGIAYDMEVLGTVFLRQGDHDRALRFLNESLRLRWEHGEKRLLTRSLDYLAELACAKGQYVRAATLAAAARALREATGTMLPHCWRQEREEVAYAVLQGLDAEALQSAQQEGARMTLEEAVNYALAGSSTFRS